MANLLLLEPRLRGGSEGGGQAQGFCPDHGFSETGTWPSRFNWDLGLAEEVKGEDKLRVHCPDGKDTYISVIVTAALGEDTKNSQNAL
jgi:hypothetical protein